MWFIAGLGNPDSIHKLTRHNLGFDVADSLVNYYKFKVLKKDKNKELYQGYIDNEKCFICKPLNYINLSGPVVSEIIKFYKIPKQKIVIIHDDIDLIVGKIKTKIGGGNGGHNGLASIDEYLGENYNRIRIGIDHPGHKDLVSSYVLNKFLKSEEEIINKKIYKMVKNIELIFSDIPLFLTKISEQN